jgi:predicted N-formylglutamate amidohydrolase
VIPGNLHLSEAAKVTRLERWFHPYHDAIEAILLERETRGVQSIAVSVHSMTASLAHQPRP